MNLCKDFINVSLLEIDQSKQLYTLIIDSFKNKYMPLLDYRVGDMVIATPEQVSNFKEKGIVEKMAGREKDLLENNVSYSMLDEVMYKNSPNILFYQFYLISNNIYILKYITKNGEVISELEKNQIVDDINNLGLKIKLSFKQVEEIAPEMSGKFTILKRGI